MKLPTASMHTSQADHSQTCTECYGLSPDSVDLMDLECADCNVTCGSLLDPEAVERCLTICTRPNGPCEYTIGAPSE